MCEFVSWIERHGKLYYLTDKEIFSEEGKLKLAGCKDNDFIGHGAIEKFYGIVGEQHENQRFWEFDKFPKEIADKLKNFDAYWGRTFEKYFMNDDLRYIIEYAPAIYKSKAWTQLLKQSSSNDDLRYIIEYAPAIYKSKAWTQLLKQSPSNDDLRYIIAYAPDTYKGKAKKLLKQNN